MVRWRFRSGGVKFPTRLYESLAQELTAKFGGVTSFSRAPAQGRWRDPGGTEHDEIIVTEPWRMRSMRQVGLARAPDAHFCAR
jgi:hypothetical protein